jgi:hypothetical protein
MLNSKLHSWSRTKTASLIRNITSNNSTPSDPYYLSLV